MINKSEKHNNMKYFNFLFLYLLICLLTSINTYAQTNNLLNGLSEHKISSVNYKYEGDFSKEFKDKVSLVTVVEKGKPYIRSDIRKSIENIYSLGGLADVKCDAQLDENGISITFILIKQKITGDIYLEGNKKINYKTIREVIRLAKGQEYDDSIAERDVNAIKDLYISHGYLNAEVSFTRSFDNRSNTVDITFKISEGSQPIVKKLIFTGTNEAIVDSTQLLRMMKEIKLGSPYKGQNALNSDVKIIEEKYREKGFLTAKVWRTLATSDEEILKQYEGIGKHFTIADFQLKNTQDNFITVIIEIQQGRMVYIKINGNKHIKDKDIISATAIHRMRSVSESVKRRSREEIENLYKSKGYYKVKVDYKTLKDIIWDFNNDTEGWSAPEKPDNVKISNGLLKILNSSPILSPELEIDTEIYLRVQIRMRVDPKNIPIDYPKPYGSFYWITNKSKKWNDKKSEKFDVFLDNQFHDYEILMGNEWSDIVTQIQIKPLNLMGADIEIESIKITTELIPIVFDIEENKQMRITEIAIMAPEGKTLTMNKDKIKKQMLTRKRSIFSFWILKKVFHGGILDETIMQEDLRAIIALYKDNGYINPSVTSKIDTDQKEGKIKVNIIIDEGPKAFVTELILEGNNRRAVKDEDIISGSDLNSKLAVLNWGNNVHRFKKENMTTYENYTIYKVIPPSVFQEYDITVDSSYIASLYADKGYFADVKYSIRFSEDFTSVSIIFHIDQGNQVKIDDKIEIRGNIRTKNKIIEREISDKLVKNKIFSLNEIEKSAQRIRDLGIFDNVKPDTQPILGSDNIYKLIIDVKERNSKSINMNAGYSSSEGFRGGVEASHINLWGTARKISGKAQVGTQGQRFESEYIEPKIFGTNAFGVINVYPYSEYIEKEYKEIRKGVSAGINWRLRRVNMVKLDYRYDVLEYNLDKVMEVTKIGRIETTFQRDSRNNVLNPENGAYYGLSLEYANPKLGGFETFTKLYFNNMYYYKLFSNIILASGVRSGYAWGLGGTEKVLTPELFRMKDYPTPRGYKWRKENIGNLLLNASIELRFPMYKWIGTAFFFDSGQVYDGVSSFSINKLKSAVGIGLRLVTPVGPFRLDYGYPVHGDGNRRRLPEIAFGNAF
ncbi:MAG: POTRA domain-containing protein [bacterium]